VSPPTTTSKSPGSTTGVLEPDERQALDRQAERHRAPLAGAEGDLLELAQGCTAGLSEA
jgi:hypothetical protein